MAQQQQERQGDNHAEMTYIAFFLVIVGTLCAIWFLGKPYIVMPFYYLNLYELKALEYFGYGTPDTKQAINLIEGVLKKTRDVWSIDFFEEFAPIKSIAGDAAKFPALIMGCLVAWIVKSKMKGTEFTKVMKLAKNYDKKNGGPFFADQQAHYWKSFSFSSKFDPNKEWEEMQSQKAPQEWLAGNGIILEEGKFDEARASEIMKQQLGNYWQSIDALPLYLKVFVALIGSHLFEKDGKKGWALRNDICQIYTYEMDEEKKTKDITDLIAKYLGDKKTKNFFDEIAKKHAYVSTVFCEAFDKAHLQGVFPTAEMLWMKSIDRTMFYTMNNIGRHTFHTEGAAGIAHWFAEKVMGTAIPEPQIEKAVQGIKEYIQKNGILKYTGQSEKLYEDYKTKQAPMISIKEPKKKISKA